MPDEVKLTEPLDEDDKRYFEDFSSLSEEEMLAHMRQARDELRADCGKLARERGLSDEYLATLDDSITKLEQAVLEEQRTNARLVDAARQMNAASDAYLDALDNQSEYPQIIDVEPKSSDK